MHAVLALRLRLPVAAGLLAAAGALPTSVRGQPYAAVEVVSYTPGEGTSPSLLKPSAALGLPAEMTGANPWDGNFSPFNPHYTGDHIVQVGTGGHLTVRLERFVLVQPGHLHLGVWENVFLTDAGGGRARNPAVVAGADSAVVEASDDGVNFVSLGTVHFTWFGNYWADSNGPYSKVSGNVRADFGKPFSATLADFDGLSYTAILEKLDGTAGGTWIDLTPSGLAQVGWIRFSGVTTGTLEIDAVAINTSLAGPPTIPEPTTAGLMGMALAAAIFFRRKRSPAPAP